MDRSHAASVPDSYRALMDSDRISRRTRDVLLARVAEPPGPPTLAPAHGAALRALVARVLPQDGPPIDLAARVDASLAGEGDGWRNATLPPDLAAYRAGLDTLDRAAGDGGFAGLPPERQDALLHAVAAGEDLPGEDHALDAAQMKAWFEDVRGDVTRLYVAHPATLARLGYSGIFYGGDGERLPGFTALGAGEREPWEPEPGAPA